MIGGPPSLVESKLRVSPVEKVCSESKWSVKSKIVEDSGIIYVEVKENELKA